MRPKKTKTIFWSIRQDSSGLTLIEIMIAIFIFSMIMAAMVALFVSSSGSYQKSRAIKNVMAEAQYAVNSISKDVRMGKIEKGQNVSSPRPEADASREDYTMITRNTDNQKVCYFIDLTNGFIGVQEIEAPDTDCPASSGYKKMVDLAGTGLKFNSASGFWNVQTDLADSNEQHGGVFMFFYFEPTDGNGMSNEEARIETYVAARDYGWRE
ncbi:MAG: prepilin-type N-terminal cleavage/methylation domain-containing protein [Parcubacteria group bacterium]|jgi:prepilin-type N-terminal cleavage/methylation domain-containing protein